MRPVFRADYLTTFMYRLSWNVGFSSSWNPQGLSRTVMGCSTVMDCSSLWFIYPRGDRSLPRQRPVTTWVYKPEVANTVESSWWWAVCRSKHVEPSINFGITNSITKLHLVGISLSHLWCTDSWISDLQTLSADILYISTTISIIFIHPHHGISKILFSSSTFLEYTIFLWQRS